MSILNPARVGQPDTKWRRRATSDFENMIDGLRQPVNFVRSKIPLIRKTINDQLIQSWCSPCVKAQTIAGQHKNAANQSGKITRLRHGNTLVYSAGHRQQPRLTDQITVTALKLNYENQLRLALVAGVKGISNITSG
jgi:hypothetical protein